MKALIIGVDGFVGRYLSEYLLKKGYEVFGTYLHDFDSDSISNQVILQKLDITDLEKTRERLSNMDPDYIFHLAAQSSAALSWKIPQKTMNVNINGTLNVLESVRGLGINTRILLIGSSEEYGFIEPNEVPVSENQPLRPGNPYAISKISQSMLGQLYSKAYKMEIIVVRAFNHIGPGQSDMFVVSEFAKRIAMIENGTSEPILKVGNIDAERDFTDVRDIVRAYELLAVLGTSGEIYNVGSGKSYKISDILERLLKLSTCKISIENDLDRKRPSDVPISRCDNRKLISTTGWENETDIESTLYDVLCYWRKRV